MNFTLLSFATLSDFLREVFSVDIPLPIQTYGFFVAMAFVAGTWIMTIEYKRKEQLSLMGPVYKEEIIGEKPSAKDMIFTFIISFLICYKLVEIIFNYREFSNNAQDFILSSRGSVLGGLICAIGFTAFSWYNKNKAALDKPKHVIVKMLPHQMAGNILVVTGIFGLLGAKIFHNLENWDRFISDPIGELLSFSGLTFFGGLIVGGFAGAWFLKKNNLSSFHTLDTAACGIPLGYALGRVGCQLSGDGCWGIENTAEAPSFIPNWAWASTFPNNVINAGSPIENCTHQHCTELTTAVFPTSLYETLMMLVIFSLLFFWLRKKINYPGMLFGIYLSLQGIERLLIEQIRVNNKLHFLGFEFTQAQLIATGLILSGLTIIYLTWKYRDKISEITKYKAIIPKGNYEIIEG